jgi:hypothetical protein
MKESKITYDAGENVEKDVRDVVTNGIQFPEMIIYGITQNPNGLISNPYLQGKYRSYIFQVQAADLSVPINHAIIPIRKKIAYRIEIQSTCHQN